MSIIALIPARVGSRRIPGKNTRMLAGYPLLVYSIVAAKQSGVFDRVVLCSDSVELAGLARQYGVEFAGRPPSSDDEPDVRWVQHVMAFPALAQMDAFSILRPTSPFRTADTIRRARRIFSEGVDSIRAVEPWHGPHPGKMWTYDNVTVRLYPIMDEWTAHAPYHSSPVQSLIPVVRQNASLEMAWTRVLHETPPTISGRDVAPFFTEGYEGFDINEEADFQMAEMKIASGEWRLPTV